MPVTIGRGVGPSVTEEPGSESPSTSNSTDAGSPVTKERVAGAPESGEPGIEMHVNDDPGDEIALTGKAYGASLASVDTSAEEPVKDADAREREDRDAGALVTESPDSEAPFSKEFDIGPPVGEDAGAYAPAKGGTDAGVPVGESIVNGGPKSESAVTDEPVTGERVPVPGEHEIGKAPVTEELDTQVPSTGKPEIGVALSEASPMSDAPIVGEPAPEVADVEDPVAGVPLVEAPVSGLFDTDAPVSDLPISGGGVRRRLGVDPVVEDVQAVGGQPRSPPVFKQDIIQAVEALEGVKHLTDDLKNTEEEAAGHFQKLQELRAQLTPGAETASTAMLQPVRAEIEDIVDEGWKLYQEYEQQMKELLEQQTEIERQTEQLKQLGEAEGISFSSSSEPSTTEKRAYLPSVPHPNNGPANSPVQVASPRSAVTEHGPEAEERLSVAEDRARHLVKVIEHTNNDAKDVIRDIRDLLRRWVGKSSSENLIHARGLVGHLKRLVKRGQQDVSELLEAINTIERYLVRLPLNQEVSSRQQSVNNAVALRESWMHFDKEFEDRVREADEALLEAIQKATRLHAYNASLQAMYRQGVQLDSKTREVTATLERAKSVRSAWQVVAEKASVVEGTQDSYAKFLREFSPLRARTQDIEEQATALVGASEALLHAVDEDLVGVRKVAAECFESEGITEELERLQSESSTIAFQQSPGLQGLVHDLRHVVSEMRLAQSEATEAAVRRGYSILSERARRANDLALESTEVLRDMNATAFNLRKAAHASRQTKGVHDVLREDGSDDSQLASLKEMAAYGADLGGQLEKLVSAVRETVLPAAEVEEVLHDPGLAAGMRYHAESVQAQSRMWETEAATLLAEMRDAMSHVQRGLDSSQRSWVRHEVVASLAVVKALLRDIETDAHNGRDHVSALLKATILLNRTNALLQRMAETEDAGDSYQGAGQLELQAQADTLGRLLRKLMHEYDVGRFESFVLSTGSAMRSADEVGLPTNIERALARLGQTQAEVARLMRERSRLAELPSQKRAPLQKALEAELRTVSRETSQTLAMLHDVLQGAVVPNDPKIQRLVFTLSEGATLASQLARGVGGDYALTDKEGKSTRLGGEGEGVSPASSSLRDIEGLSVLLGELQYQAEEDLTGRKDVPDVAVLPEAEGEKIVAMPQANESQKDLDSLKELAEEMQNRTGDVRNSLTSTVEAFERVQRCAQDLQDLRRVTPREGKGNRTPQQYVEKLSRVMEAADKDRKKLQVGLGIGLGVVLALILLVALLLALYKRRAQRRLDILTRSEKT